MQPTAPLVRPVLMVLAVGWWSLLVLLPEAAFVVVIPWVMCEWWIHRRYRRAGNTRSELERVFD